MTTENVIVVGVDATPASDAAMLVGAAEARAHGAVLRPVAVWTPLATPEDKDRIDPAYNGEKALAFVAKRVAEVLGSDPGIPIEPAEVNDLAGRGLVTASKGTRMLVVGARNKHRFSERLMGTVTEHCVRHASCPVLVVRRSDDTGS